MSTAPIAIIHGRVDDDSSPDEQDVLVQVSTVRSALRALGHDTLDVPVTLDLAEAAKALRAAGSSVAFNLAETIDGRGSLIHLAPTLLDSLGIAYTGAPCEAILLTSHKLLGKKILRGAGIDTPPWMPASRALDAAPDFSPPWIVKSVWEHASVGLEDCSVVSAREALADEIGRRTRRERMEHLFVEQWVEGREFNLALLGGTGDGEPENLPPAEIRFVGYPEGKPRMVGYKAKWDEGSYEFDHTPRTFDFPAGDSGLVRSLVAASRACWNAFDLRGYARVDFRVDSSGRPWVLEVNTNPCLSPDAGFMAAAGRAGLAITDVVRRIVADATRTGGRGCH
jgi:D-alanine-D-alanine ligase